MAHAWHIRSVNSSYVIFCRSTSRNKADKALLYYPCQQKFLNYPSSGLALSLSMAWLITGPQSPYGLAGKILRSLSPYFCCQVMPLLWFWIFSARLTPSYKSPASSVPAYGSYIWLIHSQRELLYALTPALKGFSAYP